MVTCGTKTAASWNRHGPDLLHNLQKAVSATTTTPSTTAEAATSTTSPPPPPPPPPSPSTTRISNHHDEPKLYHESLTSFDNKGDNTDEEILSNGKQNNEEADKLQQGMTNDDINIRTNLKPTNVASSSVIGNSLNEIKEESPQPQKEDDHDEQQHTSWLKEQMNVRPKIKEGSAVPSTRFGRAWGFASLGFHLVKNSIKDRFLSPRTKNKNNEGTPPANSAESQQMVEPSQQQGTSNENMPSSSSSSSLASKPSQSPSSHRTTTTSNNNKKSFLFHNTSDTSATQLANSLSRLRGAALKLGQMLSIQDKTLLPPVLGNALRKVVHQGAESMPKYQLYQQLTKELGENWRTKFVEFDDVPIAAASIGQVHKASIREDDHTIREVVVKVQYPGVAESIESDLANLNMLVKATGLAPKGLFIDEIIRVGRKEVSMECNYQQEQLNYQRFQRLVKQDPFYQQERFVVPNVVPELCTNQILTTHYAPGGTIDKVHLLSQKERNRIGRVIMKLTIDELFKWRFMQTDPNWGNFLYDYETGTTHLIDFGAAREYSKEFVDGYLRIVWANANQDRETLLELSKELGFLTGDENSIMVEAHVQSGFVVGEPFQLSSESEYYDFKTSNLTARLGEASSAFLQHRLTPPPKEVYTLHRRLAGAFNLCIKLGAKIQCRDLLEDIIRDYKFEDGKPPIQL